MKISNRDILTMVAQQIDDSVTWCRFAQVSRVCKQIIDKLLVIKKEKGTVGYCLPNGKPHGLTITYRDDNKTILRTDEFINGNRCSYLERGVTDNGDRTGINWTVSEGKRNQQEIIWYSKDLKIKQITQTKKLKNGHNLEIIMGVGAGGLMRETWYSNELKRERKLIVRSDGSIKEENNYLWKSIKTYCKHGYQREWNSAGQLLSEQEYKDGKLIEK